jgi:hypothetical protein
VRVSEPTQAAQPLIRVIDFFGLGLVSEGGKYLLSSIE